MKAYKNVRGTSAWYNRKHCNEFKIRLVNSTWPDFSMCNDNGGYFVRARFVTQSESAEHTGEALGSLFKCRGLGMSDYLEAELAPVQAVFPNTKVYLRDFHHQEKAWTRWCHDDKHGLTQINHTLLEQLCPFARTP